MYCMKRFGDSHAGVDGAGLGICIGIPTLLDDGRCGIERIVSFVIERDSLESILSLFDVGA